MGVSTTALLAALSSTALISVAPNLILFAFPQFGNDAKGNSILVMGQALAAGGLLGDVFLHTLSHTTHYEEEHVGLWILSGFAIFFVVDMILRSLGGATGGGHSHGANNHHRRHDEHKKATTTTTTQKGIFWAPTVLLNIAADALHNFTDGLAIGASFASYTVAHADVTFASLLASRGGLATISIMFHEIPHELGDYCVLLKGGFTKTQAIMVQFTTAIAAMIGTVVGLWAVEGWGGQSMVYLTAGGFVYLASVNILPQVLEEHAGFRFRLAQLCAFGTGVAFMYGVLMLEHYDHSGGHGHDHAHAHHDHHASHDHHTSHDRHEHAHGHDHHEL